MARPLAPLWKPASRLRGRAAAGLGGIPAGRWCRPDRPGPIVLAPSPPSASRRHFPGLGGGGERAAASPAGVHRQRGLLGPFGAREFGSGRGGGGAFGYPLGLERESESAELPLPLSLGNRIWRPPFSLLAFRAAFLLLSLFSCTRLTFLSQHRSG